MHQPLISCWSMHGSPAAVRRIKYPCVMRASIEWACRPSWIGCCAGLLKSHSVACYDRYTSDRPPGHWFPQLQFVTSSSPGAAHALVRCIRPHCCSATRRTIGVPRRRGVDLSPAHSEAGGGQLSFPLARVNPQSYISARMNLVPIPKMESAPCCFSSPDFRRFCLAAAELFGQPGV